MIEEIKAKIKREQKQNWKDFKMWVKKEHPWWIDKVKKYDHKREIPLVVSFLLDEFLHKKLLK